MMSASSIPEIANAVDIEARQSDCYNEVLTGTLVCCCQCRQSIKMERARNSLTALFYAIKPCTCIPWFWHLKNHLSSNHYISTGADQVAACDTCEVAGKIHCCHVALVHSVATFNILGTPQLPQNLQA
jgi:hypothetical protein